MRTAVFIGMLCVLSGLLYLVHRRLPGGSRLAFPTQFVGQGLGMFAIGLTVLVLFQSAMPQRDSQSLRSARAIKVLEQRVDSLVRALARKPE